MNLPLTRLTRTLGRRETLKYATIAAIGAVIAPLTGCSGSTLAFSKFAAGTWDVTFPTLDQERPMTVSVGADGTWWLVLKDDDQRRDSGTWSLEGTALAVTGTDPRGYYFDEGETAGASGVPAEIDADEFPTSFAWMWTDDGGDVPVTWDRETETLTLTGARYNNTPFPIVAKRTSVDPQPSPSAPASTDALLPAFLVGAWKVDIEIATKVVAESTFYGNETLGETTTPGPSMDVVINQDGTWEVSNGLTAKKKGNWSIAPGDIDGVWALNANGDWKISATVQDSNRTSFITQLIENLEESSVGIDCRETYECTSVDYIQTVPISWDEDSQAVTFTLKYARRNASAQDLRAVGQDREPAGRDKVTDIYTITATKQA